LFLDQRLTEPSVDKGLTIAINIASMAIRPNHSWKSKWARIIEMTNWIPCCPKRSKKLQKKALNVLLFNPSDIFQEDVSSNRVCTIQ